MTGEEIEMPECVTCGTHVSRQFARVFADEDDEIYACLGCTANAGIAQVAVERSQENK